MDKLDFHTKIVGVTFPNVDGSNRQNLIEELEEKSQTSQSPLPLFLRRERMNPYDSNAVAVCDSGGRQLGYLSRQVAVTVAPFIDRGERIRAEVARITGGGLTQNYGVNIRVWSSTLE